MVDIQNSKITDRLLEITKAQPYFELPKKIADSIQPILDVSPRGRIFHFTASLSDGTSSVMFTILPDRDTYILATSLTVAKSVLSPSISSEVQATPAGFPNRTLHIIRYEPVTAGQITSNFSWPQPILLQRGSDILIVNSSATASIDTSVTVILLERESSISTTGNI